MCNKIGRPKIKPANPDVIDALTHQLEMYEEIRQRAEIRNTKRGVWINEALVIRICAVLEEFDVCGPEKHVQTSLPGGKKVDSLRAARHCYAHSRGTHDRSRCRESNKRIREAFDLENQESIFRGRNILSVDTVLRPGVEACIQYSRALIQKEREAQAQEDGSDNV